MNPEVTVVMNCLNGEHFLREAIDSVYRQTHTDWEIVFWDNHSTDRTPSIAQGYDSKLRYFRAEQTEPLGLARQRAVAQARGAWIAFLDSDDRYPERSLELRLQTARQGKYAMVYGTAELIDFRGEKQGTWPARYPSGDLFGKLLSRYEIVMSSVMLRRETLQREGWTFRSDLQFSPDFNLFLKMAARYPVGVVAPMVLECRKGSHNWSHRLLHVAGTEMRKTLEELALLFPEACRRHDREFQEAETRCCFHCAVEKLLKADYPGAREELRPALRSFWPYRLIDLALWVRFPAFLLLLLLGKSGVRKFPWSRSPRLCAV